MEEVQARICKLILTAMFIFLGVPALIFAVIYWRFSD